jgi:hypothetical protein
MSGERLRHIGQGAVRVGLPEPAAAACLEVRDETPRLFRLPFEYEALARGEQELARAGDSEADEEEAEGAADGQDRLLARHRGRDQEGGRDGQDHQQRYGEEDGDGGSGAGDERGLDEDRLGLGRDDHGRGEPQAGGGGAMQSGEPHRLTGTKLQPFQALPERAVECQDGEEQGGQRGEAG